MAPGERALPWGMERSEQPGGPHGSSQKGIGHRVAMYLVGVAIGCLMLGWFALQKSRSAQNAPGAPAGEVAPTAPGTEDP